MLRRSARVACQNYIVTCAYSFRDRVINRAQTLGVSPSALAQAALLTLSQDDILAYSDPGDAPHGDRETIKVRSGVAKNRLILRKPRLQLRLPVAGLSQSYIRKALALLIERENDDTTLHPKDQLDAKKHSKTDNACDSVLDNEQELKRLTETIHLLSFDILPEGVRTRSEALYVLGFSPHARPSPLQLKQRFRERARIHHPDSLAGDHLRMAQINQALNILRLYQI